MTPEQFIATWKDNPLTERAGAQQWFSDLCDLLGVDKPRDSENYCFERGARKAGGGQGWADVWKRACFGWENKQPGRPLEAALKQLTDYALHLENPPLLVVADRERIVIHTAFTGYPDEPREIRLAELVDPAKREILRWVFTDPEKLKPGKSFKAITEEAAARFAALAARMRGRGLEGQRVAHFLVQCLFCMFAEDERLLPENLFADLLKNAGGDTEKARDRLQRLFRSMQNRDGVYGDHDIPWFNGGLFETLDIPPLEADDLAELHAASRDMDWRDIDPTIFGTLFERGLDPKTRAPLGAHYTDVETIGKLIDPVVTQPLLREWDAAKAIIQAGVGKSVKTQAYRLAHQAYQGFLLRLYEFRVLDAACGSGNFLYLGLKALRDIEKRVRVEARDLGIHDPQVLLMTGPHNILGLEINDYAAELARVTVWIGDIQWCRRNGYQHATNPILQSLDGIEHRDALLNPDGTEADWPKADVIVGNPPFLGDKWMRTELGDTYVDRLRQRYEGRVPGGADLVTYWFEKARAQIAAGKAQASGLVATNSIRQKRNRVVLEQILASTRLFEAWSDEPWINEGAAVRVSLVCFGQNPAPAQLDGQQVAEIHADLTGSSAGNLTAAQPLASNKGRSFFGLCLAGPFKVDTPTALAWLKATGNPNGRPNSDVVRPIYNGSDITRRWAGNWVVDFALMPLAESADYLEPFAHVETHVKPVRISNKRAARAESWWWHGEKRPAMRAAMNGLSHYIVTPETAKHRFFVKLPVTVAPEHRLIVIPRQDDLMLGVLSSRIHITWALALGGTLEDRPVYNSSLCFETFPFPPGFDLQQATVSGHPSFAVIEQAATDLNAWRESWLNPPEWMDWDITPEEITAGFPARPAPKTEMVTEWKIRTMTNLYNDMPAGLRIRQEALDRAVAAAYGWDDYTPDMPDVEILRRLLALNRERSEI